ncbi:hypothetical protein D9615_001543 [Tricholomella constricta]|uniref:DUF7598 domain-containing protein n=1 Tax=Tricholomella constricta TaxID=117010 RepID=A0A8H5MAE0_9AGAR|nr:hypothetical protein D9615_001543 [Tricholomella constricta]
MLPRRAIFFMGLNGVRFLSIVSLLLVFASTILVMVTNIQAVNAFESNKGDSTMEDCDYIEGSTVPNQPAGVFWAVVSSLLIIFQTVVLLLSEIGWPAPFFDRYFPVLGQGFGLGALGIFQCLISTQILSHHVDDFTLVAAFFLFALGCVNMFLGLIFRESAKEKRSITSWRAESKGVLPTHTGSSNAPVFMSASPAFVTRQFTGSEKEKDMDRPDTAEFNTWRSPEKAGYGFGRQGEKAAGLRGFILQRPEESLPRYATPPPSQYRNEPQNQHEEHHVNLTRTPSVASSSSSFASPYRESTQTASEVSAGAVKTPVFRSSPTAL